MTNVIWVYVVGIFLAICVIAGGSSLLSQDQFFALSALSVLILGMAIWRLRSVELEQSTTTALVILASGFGLMFLQLVPLPQPVWSVLGGRQFVVDAFVATQQARVWLPLSLNPEATRQDILALLPGAATFVAMLSVSIENQIQVAFCIVGLALIEMVLGAAQVSAPIVSGSFVNPNFFAALLYMSIPFVAYAGTRDHQKWKWLIASVAVLVSLVAIGQSGSRIGLVLGIAVALASGFTSRFASRSFASTGLVVSAAITAVIMLFGGTGLERFAGLQAAVATRATMLDTSLQALWSFLPAGSGFGSFVPIYQVFETPSMVTPSYVNHAHNDWLELLLEGGLLVAALMVAFVGWFGAALRATWSNNSTLGKAAAISACAVLLHSLADYPLRTPALLVMFACCCAILARASSAHKVASHAISGSNYEPAFSRAGAMI